MNTTDVWLAILVLTLISVVGRSAFLFAPERWHPRGPFKRALGYAPMAAMVAIVAPEIFQAWLQARGSARGIDWQLFVNARVVSALALVILLRFTRHEFLALFFAGAVYWLLHSIGLK